MTTTSTTIIVTGMTCDHCVGSVRDELTKIDAVTDVTVDLASGEVAITSDAPVDAADIAAAVDEAGYEVQG